MGLAPQCKVTDDHIEKLDVYAKKHGFKNFDNMDMVTHPSYYGRYQGPVYVGEGRSEWASDLKRMRKNLYAKIRRMIGMYADTNGYGYWGISDKQ
jgi:hypothetical protein